MVWMLILQFTKVYKILNLVQNVIVTWYGGGRSVGRARVSWSGGPGFDSRCGHLLWLG